MSTERIVCLANSYKHDHRCVAGISLVTKQWVRLVGRKVPGCLTLKEASYPDGREVALLDVFEAESWPAGSRRLPRSALSVWFARRTFGGGFEKRKASGEIELSSGSVELAASATTWRSQTPSGLICSTFCPRESIPTRFCLAASVLRPS